MKVEVELEDLETIVFATAVINTIETALQQRKQDPFVKPHLAYSLAHGNLVAAMNGARRASADTATQWDGELDKEELKFLKEFITNPVIEIDGAYRLKHQEVDRLMAKGCIRCGQLVAGAVWPGESKADIKPIAGFAIAITPRGRDKLEKALHAGKS